MKIDGFENAENQKAESGKSDLLEKKLYETVACRDLLPFCPATPGRLSAPVFGAPAG